MDIKKKKGEKKEIISKKEKKGKKKKIGVNQGGGGGGEVGWEFDIGRCKRVYIEWINSKVLLHSTGTVYSIFCNKL